MNRDPSRPATGRRAGETGPIRIGGCVQLPDGRIARVRDEIDGRFRVRVRRTTSKTHQFLTLDRGDLQPVSCPPGWMSVEGYNRYLRVTLAKMRQRRAERVS